MLLKCCIQYASKSGKLSSGHRTGQGQFSFQSKESQCQRKLKILHNCTHLSSVQFSHSVMSDSLRPHGLQHARPPCPLPIPGVYSNSCPSSWWCHRIISSSVITFSSCLQSFLAPGSFQMSQFFQSGGQSIGASASVYSGLISFRMEWLDLLAVQGTLKSLLQHHSSKASILWH